MPRQPGVAAGGAAHALDGSPGLPVILGRQGARHAEPVFRGNIALADGQQAAEPGFRVERAITVGRALPHVHVMAMRHQAGLFVEEKPVVALVDQPGAARGEFREGLADHDQAGGQPGGVHEGDEMAGPLQRGGVVVVIEKAVVGLQAFQGQEGRAQPLQRLAPVDQLQLEGGGDGQAMQADVGDVGVIADMGGLRAQRAGLEFHPIQRQAMPAVGQRIEPAPGIRRQPAQESLVVPGQGVRVGQEYRWPTREPRLEPGPRRDWTAQRLLPGLLAWGDGLIRDGGTGVAGFDQPDPVDEIGALPGLQGRGRQHQGKGGEFMPIAEARHRIQRDAHPLPVRAQRPDPIGADLRHARPARRGTTEPDFEFRVEARHGVAPDPEFQMIVGAGIQPIQIELQPPVGLHVRVSPRWHGVAQLQGMPAATAMISAHDPPLQLLRRCSGQEPPGLGLGEIWRESM